MNTNFNLRIFFINYDIQSVTVLDHGRGKINMIKIQASETLQTSKEGNANQSQDFFMRMKPNIRNFKLKLSPQIHHLLNAHSIDFTLEDSKILFSSLYSSMSKENQR